MWTLKGPRATSSPPTGCDETQEVIGALVIFQKPFFGGGFCFSWFPPKEIQRPNCSVCVHCCLFVCLFARWDFCEAMRAAQSDTSSGNGSIRCGKSRAGSYFRCLFEFVCALRRLGLNGSAVLPKPEELKENNL